MSPASSPLDAFLAAFQADIEAKTVRPLAEYLSRFPGDEDGIAQEYVAHKRGGNGAPAADRIAHYKIVRELGRGGQATVYLAEDTRLHRKVALKVLTGLGRLEGDALARFHREASVASKLEHPGICGVHEAGIEHGVAYIAMRYVEGDTLATRIAASRGASRLEGEGARSFVVLGGDAAVEPGAPSSAATASRTTRHEVLRIAELIERAARALHEAHEAGIVHRDIKPGNIMLTPKGEPVLLDFGLARDLEGEEQTLTRTGDLFGTPAYMAPEQLMAQRVRVDRRADVWALGVTLYEALTLARPFDAPTREGVYQAIQFKDPARPGGLNPAIPSDLDVVVTIALEKDPDRRYHTAEAFAEDLRRAREGEPIAAKPVSVIGRAWRWARRRPARAALVALLVVGVPTVATLGGFLWASLPELRAQKLLKTRQELERHLEDGFLSIHEWRPAKAVQDFEAALALDPEDPEALAGLAFAKSEDHDHSGALAVFDRARDLGKNPGLVRARQRVLVRAGKPALPAEALPELRTAADFFLAGYSLVTAAWLENDGDPRFKEALTLLDRAVSRSSARRLLYHLHRTRTAARAKDEAAARAGADDLIDLWPDQAYAWYGRGFALSALDPDQSIAAYRHAQALRESPLFVSGLGGTLIRLKRIDEAIAVLREAVRLKPDLVEAHNNLGAALCRQGFIDEAMSSLREAIRLRPDHPDAHNNLGLALTKRGLLDEAIAAHREAIRLKPDEARFHYNLANTLQMIGRYDETISSYKEAIRLDPKQSNFHVGLGVALMDIPRLGEATAAFRESIRLRPDYAAGYAFLGLALQASGHLDEALAAHREAVRLKPDDPEFLTRLGSALNTKGLVDEAMAPLRDSIRLKPTATAWYNLAIALRGQGRVDDSMAAYREAIRLKPYFGEPHCDLAGQLTALHRFREALVEYRLGHEAGSKQLGWNYPSEGWVENAEERLAEEEALETQFAAHLAAGTKPGSEGELAALARIALDKGHPALAARWFQLAFEGAPELADSLADGHRLLAARATLLASASSAASRPDSSTALRLKALSWLEAHVAAVRQASSEGALLPRDARALLLPLNRLSDFASVRGTDAISTIPAAEQPRWSKLWADIASQLAALDGKPDSR